MFVFNLILGSILNLGIANALYADEAYVTDWHLNPIGEYKCVISNSKDDTYTIISDFDDKTSLLSYVNKTTGGLISRNVLNFKAEDVSLDFSGTNLVVKDTDKHYNLISLEHGFAFGRSLNVPNNTEFLSVCAPNLEHVNVKSKESTIEVVDPVSGLVVIKSDLVQDFQSVIAIETDYSRSLKLLISTSDNIYRYYHIVNNELIDSWDRDESIVNIIDHAFIDIEDTSVKYLAQEIEKEQEIANIWEAYYFRLTNNIQRFALFLKQNRYSPGRILTKVLELNSGKDELLIKKRNLTFGLSKLLLVLTKNGKIAALDMLNKGHSVWTINPPLEDTIKIEWFEELHTFYVISKDGNYIIYKFSDEHLTPTILTKGSFRLGRSSIESIHSLDSGQTFFVVLTNGNRKLFRIDNTPLKLEEELFIAEHTNKSITGSFANESELESTWGINVSEDEEILAYASKGRTSGASLGNVLGNKDTLYKYLYPNLAAYAVINKSTGLLHVNLIDTVSGELFLSETYSSNVDYELPVNIVFGENWFVISYFSKDPIPEQKLTVIELYESLTPNLRVSNSTENYHPLRTINKPEAISKTYFIPQIITNMGISKTKYGITTEAILLELENEQITFLPKFVLSARRKEESKMTDDDRKDFMASPYVPAIPVNDYYVISHFRSLLMGDSKLVAVATNLESTSYVCDVGHDVFCTRISPSGQFDVMSPTFEKGTLLVTVFIALGACLVMRPYVANKKLKTEWLVAE